MTSYITFSTADPLLKFCPVSSVFSSISLRLYFDENSNKSRSPVTNAYTTAEIYSSLDIVLRTMRQTVIHFLQPLQVSWIIMGSLRENSVVQCFGNSESDVRDQ